MEKFTSCLFLVLLQKGWLVNIPQNKMFLIAGLGNPGSKRFISAVRLGTLRRVRLDFSHANGRSSDIF